MKRLIVIALVTLSARASAQTVRLRNVNGTGGVVSVGSVGDTVWLSIKLANGDLFTMRADSLAMAGWADGPALITDQAIAFVPLPPDSSAYFVRGVQGTQRDSIQLSADSARAVFSAMRGKSPTFTPPVPALLRFQVKRHAAAIVGTHAPEYPESLRSSHIEGNAQARFVIDSTGRVVARSITILSSTHPQFASAVIVGVREMRFTPAQIDGRNVAEIVDMGFRFHLPANIDILPMGQ